MQPRRLVDPLRLMVFHVTNNGNSSLLFAPFAPAVFSAGRDNLDDEFDDASVGRDGVEEDVDGDEDDVVEGLPASKRLIAAGRPLMVASVICVISAALSESEVSLLSSVYLSQSV